MVLNSTFVLKREMVSGYSNFGAAIVIIMAALAVVVAYFALKMNYEEVKKSNQNIVELMFINVCAILIIAVTIMMFNSLRSDREDYVSTSLTEIKDAITVENDKVTIQSLSRFEGKYKYIDDYKSDQKQIFKLEEDNFFERYQLVDQNSNKLSIDSEEYKMLNEKRQK